MSSAAIGPVSWTCAVPLPVAVTEPFAGAVKVPASTSRLMRSTGSSTSPTVIFGVTVAKFSVAERRIDWAVGTEIVGASLTGVTLSGTVVSLAVMKEA